MRCTWNSKTLGTLRRLWPDVTAIEKKLGYPKRSILRKAQKLDMHLPVRLLKQPKPVIVAETPKKKHVRVSSTSGECQNSVSACIGMEQWSVSRRPADAIRSDIEDIERKLMLAISRTDWTKLMERYNALCIEENRTLGYKITANYGRD